MDEGHDGHHHEMAVQDSVRFTAPWARGHHCANTIDVFLQIKSIITATQTAHVYKRAAPLVSWGQRRGTGTPLRAQTGSSPRPFTRAHCLSQ
jgi:hypothetical protein